MNDRGKSDRPVVPARPAKPNSSQSFWELFEQVQRAEGRGLAEENGEERAAVGTPLPLAGPAKQVDRTQSRVGAGTASGAAGPEDLHSALDRVRQAALADEGLKFTALWHHVYNVDCLRQAYLEHSRKGMLRRGHFQ